MNFTSMKITVIIIGTGQLGKRYLDGIAGCSLPLEIWLCDSLPQALSAAVNSENARKIQKSGTPIYAASRIDDLPGNADLCIVTTTAGVRPEVCENLSKLCSPQYWILEKFLSQTGLGLQTIEKSTKSAKGAWVNLPRRAMSWHTKIGQQLKNCGPFQMCVSGGKWGLACNAVHFLDLCAFWSNEEIVSIDNRALNPEWITSKRVGFAEILGSLEVFFSGGSSLRLECHDHEQPLEITVESSSFRWIINEKEGKATCSDGSACLGKLEFQTDLTGPLVDSILTTGNCLLPDLQTALPPHRALLSSLLEHWNMSHDRQDLILPIT
jgi:hypothetical protein